jgi:hypothetical protein
MYNGLQMRPGNGLPGPLFKNVGQRRSKTRVSGYFVQRRHKP